VLAFAVVLTVTESSCVSHYLLREASVRAIESVQEASLKALAKQNVQRGLRSMRKKHWFEKFNWFISSEGYLVLSGSDAQQNV
jgi:predicted ribosome quality control (RQC) complex YloA/Tae2 family protein